MQDNPSDRPDILAVCTGNICRSPMAEGLLKSLFGHARMTIRSAGTHAVPGNPATDFSVIASSEHGVDISGHRARLLNSDMIRRSGIILCMEPLHVESVLSHEPSVRDRTYNLADFSGDRKMKAIPDPYGCSLREYRQCFTDIERCIRNFAASFSNLPCAARDAEK